MPDSTLELLFAFAFAFVLIPAAYVAAALGTPVFSGILGYRVARRIGSNCIVCAGVAALCAVGVPLAVSGVAETFLSDQGLAQSVMVSTAFLLQLPTLPFDGMYDRAYHSHVQAASAAVIFAVVWLAGAAMCASRRGRTEKYQRQ